MFQSGKFSQIKVKKQKSTNNLMSSFGLIEKNMELSHICLAVYKLFKIDVALEKPGVYLKPPNVKCFL